MVYSQGNLFGQEDRVVDRSFTLVDHDNARALIARGINPYNSDYDETSFGEGFSDAFLGISEDLPANVRSPGGTKINYDLFGRLIEGTSLEPENPFAHIVAKRRILRRSGYTHLTGKDSERVTIDSAKEHRVGLAFKNTYRAYNNRTGN